MWKVIDIERPIAAAAVRGGLRAAQDALVGSAAYLSLCGKANR